MKSLFYPIFAALLITTVSACGPTWSTVSLSDSREAIAEMEAAQAEQYAPYEYYSSKLYLEKAQEKNAYAQFQTASEFAKKSEAFAQEARKKALSKKQLAGLKEGELEQKEVVKPEPPKETDKQGASLPPGAGLPSGKMFKAKSGSKPPPKQKSAKPAGEGSEEEGIPPIFSTPPEGEGSSIPELGGE